MDIKDRIILSMGLFGLFFGGSSILYGESAAILIMQIVFALVFIAFTGYYGFQVYVNILDRWDDYKVNKIKKQQDIDLRLIPESNNMIAIDYKRGGKIRQYTVTKKGIPKVACIKEDKENDCDYKQALKLDDIIKSYPHLGVYGPTGGGKSTMMRHIIKRFNGTVIIFDTHDDISPGNSIEDYEIMERNIDAFMFELKTRKAQKYRTTGKNDKNNQLLIIDECLDCLGAVANMPEMIKQISSQGRKFGLYLLLGTSARTASAFDLNGLGQLLHHCVKWIQVKKDNRTGEHTAQLMEGFTHGEEIKNPGPCEPIYIDNVGDVSQDTQYTNCDLSRDVTVRQCDNVADGIIDLISKIKDATERKIVQCYYNLKQNNVPDISRNMIAKMIYNGGSNGRKTKEIGSILNKYGVNI